MGLHMPSLGEFICLGSGFGLIGFLIWRLTARPTPPPLPPPGFPIAPLPADGPGRYEISGVDRESKMETTWHCEAQSLANARVKAELEGIIVTDIRRVS